MDGLYIGRVMHRRPSGHAYRFVYRIACVLVDIDKLALTAARLRWFSLDRWNLFSIRMSDHLPAGETDARNWIERLLTSHAIQLEGGSIRLLCMPRMLGYVFNPLSIWYCHGPSGDLRAIVCEVRNTFGEKHHYVLPGEKANSPSQPTYVAEKVFHVSPFFKVDGCYRFNFVLPGEAVGVRIEYRQAEKLALLATLAGRRRELDDTNLLHLLWTQPFLTLKVMLMIHWQAMKLWLRGARYQAKPRPPTEEASPGWVHRPDSNY